MEIKLGPVPLIYRGVKTKYYITSFGEVYNKNGYMLKPFFGKKGYVKCAIQIKGKIKGIYVHVAVWESFMGSIPNKMEINHIRAIKTDNRLSQLELVTKQGHMDHAKQLGLIPNGEKCKRSKYKEKTIKRACELLELGIQYSEVSELTGLPISVISSLANHKTWKHITSNYDIHGVEKHVYTKDEIDVMIRMFNEGFSYKEIANKLSLPVHSIKCKLFHMGFTVGKNHIYTHEEEVELMSLYEKGIPHSELAKKYNVSLRSIYGKIHRLKRK